jgi:hypothetical protein
VLGWTVDPAAGITQVDTPTLSIGIHGGFPGSMAKRVQTMCQAAVDQYDGDVSAVWPGAADGKDLLRRIAAPPKAKA